MHLSNTLRALIKEQPDSVPVGSAGQTVLGDLQEPVLCVLILALSAVGCEREDLHYPAPAPSPVSGDTTQKGTEPVDTSQTAPPLDEGKARELAARTAGQWRGTLSTKYIDYRGVTITNSCLSQMTFMLDEKSQNGKQVYRMSFDWEVGGDGRLRLKYADSRTMHSTKYVLSGRSLTLRLEKQDGLETDEYLLERVGE